MNRISLPGVDGSNPLGFLAALGLLRLFPGARLGFAADGSFRAFVDGAAASREELAAVVLADASAAADERAPWRFTYTKAATKKQASQQVADLKPPPEDFRKFLSTCVQSWLEGKDEAVSYATAYATDVAVDGKGNTKPTAFHFTAANQTFLGTVESIRRSLTMEWLEQSLFEGDGLRAGSNLRWDPSAERNWALMANNPSGEGTRVNAPLEWLSFRGLPLLPNCPCNSARGARIMTTGVKGRGENMSFSWPLWSLAASLQTVRSILGLDWSLDRRGRAVRGIFVVCSSSIRRSSQGFGNFGPSSVDC